jgi:hypothetical protein
MVLKHLSLTQGQVHSSTEACEVDHVESHGGTIIAPGAHIGLLTGTTLVVNCEGERLDYVVGINQATLGKMHVKGGLVISGPCQFDDLLVDGKLTVCNGAILKATTRIKARECVVKGDGVIDALHIQVNVATLEKDSTVIAQDKLIMNHSKIQEAKVTTDTCNINSAVVRKSKMVIRTRVKGNHIRLWDSTIECPHIAVNALVLKRSTATISTILTSDDLEVIDSHLKSKKNFRMNLMMVQGDSKVETESITTSSLYLRGGTVDTDRLHGDVVTLDEGSTLNCSKRFNVKHIRKHGGTLNIPEGHDTKRRKILRKSI